MLCIYTCLRFIEQQLQPLELKALHLDVSVDGGDPVVRDRFQLVERLQQLVVLRPFQLQLTLELLLRLDRSVAGEAARPVLGFQHGPGVALEFLDLVSVAFTDGLDLLVQLVFELC